MKITVCQIDNIPKNFQQSFKNLSNSRKLVWPLDSTAAVESTISRSGEIGRRAGLKIQ